jgi:hypothetical protein
VLEECVATDSAQRFEGHREQHESVMNPNDITHAIIGAAITEDALEIALESSGFQNDSSVSSNPLCWKNALPPIQRRGLKYTENNMKPS